jgi:hypothetical protein
MTYRPLFTGSPVTPLRSASGSPHEDEEHDDEDELTTPERPLRPSPSLPSSLAGSPQRRSPLMGAAISDLHASLQASRSAFVGYRNRVPGTMTFVPNAKELAGRSASRIARKVHGKAGFEVVMSDALPSDPQSRSSIDRLERMFVRTVLDIGTGADIDLAASPSPSLSLSGYATTVRGKETRWEQARKHAPSSGYSGHVPDISGAEVGVRTHKGVEQQSMLHSRGHATAKAARVAMLRAKPFWLKGNAPLEPLVVRGRAVKPIVKPNPREHASPSPSPSPFPLDSPSFSPTPSPHQHRHERPREA